MEGSSSPESVRRRVEKIKELKLISIVIYISKIKLMVWMTVAKDIVYDCLVQAYMNIHVHVNK